MGTEAEVISGVVAGVPFLVMPPVTGPAALAPVVVAWHLLDAPRTEAAFAAALPLQGLDAWRIYLGLPLSGSRLPPGGLQELMRLAGEDPVLNVYGPLADQAVAEFEKAFVELGRQLTLGPGPLALVGGSMGAAVAGLVLAESSLDVRASVLISPMVQLRPVVAMGEERFGMRYSWSERSLAVARRLDLVARVEEITRRADQPAVLLVVGAEDAAAIREPAAELQVALAQRYADPDRARLVAVPGMEHALAEEPGIEPAPQLPAAREVDRLAVDWLRHYLF